MSQIIRVKTAIIGAGFSGMSAAVNLLNKGRNDFMIFEALERIGGRVDTISNDKGYFEIGAQWVHGQDGNPIYEIAKKNNLILEGYDKLTKKTKEYEKASIKAHSSPVEKINVHNETDKTIFATQNGFKISTNFAKSVYNVLTRIISDAEGLPIDRSSLNASRDARVGDYLHVKFVEAVRNQLDIDLTTELGRENSIERILYGIFLMRLKRENIRSGSPNVFDVSLGNFATYQEFPGISYVELKHGYKPVLDALIGDNKEAIYSRLKLRHHLKKIMLDSSLAGAQSIFDTKSDEKRSKFTDDRTKAVLLLCDETDDQKPRDIVVVAENVVCTMSLGYLKENFNNFLEPLSLLSPERRQAVNRLGFGTINKIFLTYDRPFWGDDLALINMIWLPETNFRMDKMIARNSTKRMWYEDICKIEVVRSQPNTLCAWLAGSEEFEKLEERVVAEECTRLLRQFLADENIPAPKSIIRTKWNSNRYSRGSYSHLPIGAEPSDFDLLSQPIPSADNPIIMFAGEHTHRDYFSTVHGAYLSGLRESERILNKK